jgi:PAS domain S-box-containing protein
MKEGEREIGTLAGALSAIEKPEDARALLAAIVASSEDAIVSKTLNGIVTSWNVAAERLFGYTAPEMVGESILRVIPPELHQEEVEILAKMRKGERIERYETVRVRKDGRRFDISLTISPVRDSNGKVHLRTPGRPATFPASGFSHAPGQAGRNERPRCQHRRVVTSESLKRFLLNRRLVYRRVRLRSPQARNSRGVSDAFLRRRSLQHQLWHQTKHHYASMHGSTRQSRVKHFTPGDSKFC